MEIETCHGCVFLGGLITTNEIFAQCGEGVWQGERYTSIGYDIAKPTRCARKILRSAEQQLTTHKGTSFLRSLWNRFIGKNDSHL